MTLHSDWELQNAQKVLRHGNLSNQDRQLYDTAISEFLGLPQKKQERQNLSFHERLQPIKSSLELK